MTDNEYTIHIAVWPTRRDGVYRLWAGGRTWGYSEALKVVGFRFDRDRRSWVRFVFGETARDRLLAILWTELPNNTRVVLHGPKGRREGTIKEGRLILIPEARRARGR